MANNITILVRADTAANWEGKDSLLRMREIGYDQTNRRFKVGDGTTTWKNLPYVKPDVVNDLLTGGADAALSAEQGKKLKALIDANPSVINSLTSTSTTDALSANQGKVLKGLIDGKTSVAVVNSLTSTSTTAALSANQGKVLNDKLNKYSTEDWTFTLEDGSTVTKKVALA